MIFDPVVLYVDPGTGMAVLYALAAVGTGIAFKFRQFSGWFSRKFRRSE